MPVAAELAADLRERRRQIDQLELLWAIDAHRLAQSGCHEVAGSLRASDLLRHRCDMGEGAVRDRLAVGAQVDKLERSAAAVVEGEIGFGQLVGMAHTAQTLARATGGVPFDEAKLLDRAREESVNKCYFHHRLVHEGGWRLVRDENGHMVMLRPPPSFGPWAQGPVAESGPGPPAVKAA